MATVLIVDDDKHTRALLERALRHDERVARYAVRVVQAGDGVEGLRVYEAEKPEIVITDLLMPRMDGFRFCKELRTRAAGRPLGLLVLSGVYRDVTVSIRLRDEVGAALYTKPYQLKDLVTAVDKQLARIAQLRPEENETARVEAVDTPLPIAQPRVGRIEQTPLPHLLLDLHEERATGTLELKRGKIEKRIDLVVGHPVAVTSNQRAEMLGHYLVVKGVISEKVHQRALEMARDEEKKVGEALTELGVLSAADLIKHLTGQARYKITRALRWPDGDYAYRPNRDLLSTAGKGNALDPVAVVFLGLKKTASVEAAARTLAPLAGHRLELTVRGARVRHTVARAFGAAFAEALEGRPTVDKLLGPPFEAATAMPALEALLLTACVADAGLADEPSGVLKKAAEPPGVEELSGSFKLPLPPPPPPPPSVYDQIFTDEPSDSGMRKKPAAEQVEVVDLAPASDGVPEEIQLGDSSIIEMELTPYGSGPIVTLLGAENDKARDDLQDALLTEYLRLQGKDLYAVLRVSHEADTSLIETAYAERMATFSLEKYEPYNIGPDYGKLEELHAAYRRAGETLTTPERRAAYDREQNGRRARSSDGQMQMMGAELAFRAGERRLSLEKLAGAVEHFRLAVDSSPEVADYQAALGWALHRAGGAGAKEAATHIAQALAIDPDHAGAHEYLGRMLADEGKDDAAAAEHLEKALDAKPPRMGALEALAAVRSRRGELPLLERLHRTLIRRLQPGETDLALRLWRALGRAYAEQGNRVAARTSFQTALRLDPTDTVALDELAALATSFEEKCVHLRARWRLDPGLPAPGQTLLRAARAEGRHDAAFLCAAALVARSSGDGDAEELHKRYRPRFLIRAMRRIDHEIWPTVRHADDDAELGELFAALAPAGQEHAPTGLEVTPDSLVADRDLPEDFRRVRAYVAYMLGVHEARVARRPDFGGELHLGALPDPVLLVGPDTLASSDKVDLAFRLGRAMSYLWPGRAFAGSRPARILKELFVAAVRLGGYPATLEDSAGAARALAALEAMPRAKAGVAGGLASAIASSRSSVNLSSWSRSLARSADRVGLVLCGDPAVAAAAARQLGGEDAASDVLDYALSDEHLRVRQLLGLSVDV